MRDDILIMSVFHQEPARNDPQPDKSHLLVQTERAGIAPYHCIELEDPESELSPLLHTV